MSPPDGHAKKRVVDNILRALDEAEAKALDTHASNASVMQAVRDTGLSFNADSVRRWTRIAGSLRGEIMAPAKRLFDELANGNESSALVVKVLQRGSFADMDCVEKVVCLKSLRARTAYVRNKGSSGAWTPNRSESFIAFVKKLVSRIRETDVGSRFTMSAWCGDGNEDNDDIRNVAGLVADLIKRESFTSSRTGRYNEGGLLVWVWQNLQPELHKCVAGQQLSTEDRCLMVKNGELLDTDNKLIEIAPSNEGSGLVMLSRGDQQLEEIELTHRISPVKRADDVHGGSRTASIKASTHSKDREPHKVVGKGTNHPGPSDLLVRTMRSSLIGISSHSEGLQNTEIQTDHVRSLNVSASLRSRIKSQERTESGNKNSKEEVKILLHLNRARAAMEKRPLASGKKRKLGVPDEGMLKEHNNEGLVACHTRKNVHDNNSFKLPPRLSGKRARGDVPIEHNNESAPSDQPRESHQIIPPREQVSISGPRLRHQLPKLLQSMDAVENLEYVYNEYSLFQYKAAKRCGIKTVVSDKVDLPLDSPASFHTVMDLTLPLRPYSPLFHFMNKQEFDAVISEVAMACRRAERNSGFYAPGKPLNFHQLGLNGIPGFEEILYLRTCSIMLEDRGYVILPAILSGGCSKIELYKKVDALFLHLERVYARDGAHPSNDSVPENEEDRAIWNYTNHRDEALSGDVDKGPSVNERAITCSVALYRNLIRRNHEVLRAKLSVELFIAKLLSSFTIETLIPGNPLLMPNLGARFEMSSSDFTFRVGGTFGAVTDSGQPLIRSVSSGDDVPLCHGVAAIFTGSTPTWIRVWPGSHKISAMTPSTMKAKLQRACMSKCLFVPPYSILYLRNDVLCTDVSSETRISMAKSGLVPHVRYRTGTSLDSSYKKIGSKFMDIHGLLLFTRPSGKLFNQRFPTDATQKWELNDECIEIPVGYVNQLNNLTADTLV